MTRTSARGIAVIAILLGVWLAKKAITPVQSFLMRKALLRGAYKERLNVNRSIGLILGKSGWSGKAQEGYVRSEERQSYQM